MGAKPLHAFSHFMEYSKNIFRTSRVMSTRREEEKQIATIGDAEQAQEEELEWLPLPGEDEDLLLEGECSVEATNFRTVHMDEAQEREDIVKLMGFLETPFSRRLNDSTIRQYIPKLVNYLEYTGLTVEQAVDDADSFTSFFLRLHKEEKIYPLKHFIAALGLAISSEAYYRKVDKRDLRLWARMRQAGNANDRLIRERQVNTSKREEFEAEGKFISFGEMERRLGAYREVTEQERNPKAKAMMKQRYLLVRMLIELPTQRTQIFSNLIPSKHLRLNEARGVYGIIYTSKEYKTGKKYGRQPTILSKEIGELLLDWLAEKKKFTSSPYLFVTFRQDDARPRLERWTKKVLGNNITPLDLRHICASQIAEVASPDELRKIATAFRHSVDVAKSFYIETNQWREQSETQVLYAGLRRKLMEKEVDAAASVEEEEGIVVTDGSDSDIEPEAVRAERARKRYLQMSEHQRIRSLSKRRQRVSWTAEEDETLTDAVAKEGRGRWSMILRRSPVLKDRRTSKDLYDRYRVLEKTGKVAPPPALDDEDPPLDMDDEY